MIRFTADIQQFGRQGEKTGWTYITLSAGQAAELKPGNKKGFRVKGKLDQLAINGVALMPMGNGDFILPLNAAMRKAIRKGKGDRVQASLEEDHSEVPPPPELLECLEDEPEALAFFNSLTKGHQRYFTNWILSAKTEGTKAGRIAQTVNALVRKMDFGLMLRSLKKDREDLPSL
ncbi:MAG TPA: YdeI/OmpD-associated family protein [Chitinophagaceae bacterium]|nr:YdeI/OmpD-associated family protein [Chitinophagaceae bacterium]